VAATGSLTSSVNTRRGSWSSLLGVGDGFGFTCPRATAVEKTSTKMIRNGELKLDYSADFGLDGRKV
jgi:hypothetical protein